MSLAFHIDFCSPPAAKSHCQGQMKPCVKKRPTRLESQGWGTSFLYPWEIQSVPRLAKGITIKGKFPAHLGRAVRESYCPSPGTVFQSREDPCSLGGTVFSGRMVLFPENRVVSEQQASAVLLPGCGSNKGKFAPDSAKTA